MQIFYYSKNMDRRIINILGIETEDVINKKYRKFNYLLNLIREDSRYHKLEILLDNQHTIDLNYAPLIAPLINDTRRYLIKTYVTKYSAPIKPRQSQLTIKFVW